MPDIVRHIFSSVPPAAKPSNGRRSGRCARPGAGTRSSTRVRAGHVVLRVLRERRERAAQASLCPRRFGVDAIILFYDITTLPVAMGLPFELKPGAGPGARPPDPHAGRPRAPRTRPDPDAYAHIRDLLKRVKEELRGELPVLVFAGAPFTVATYCIGTGKDVAATRRFAAEQPAVWDGLLDRLTGATVGFLQHARSPTGRTCTSSSTRGPGCSTPDEYDALGAAVPRAHPRRRDRACRASCS